MLSEPEQRPFRLQPGAIPWLIGAAAVFGIVCRVAQYVANTSVWHDEAFVALNVLSKTFPGLLGALDYDEASPPGFLIVEKLVVSLLGRSEFVLRLVPLLAGLATVVCFAGLARKVCGTGSAWLWAVLLMVSSPNLIRHSSMVKHFSLDLLCAVLLVWLAIRIGELDVPRGALVVWGAIGSVGLWLSYASLFVFAGTSLAISCRAVRTWRRVDRIAYLFANAAVLGSFGLLMEQIHAQRSGQLLNFWRNSMAFPELGSLIGFAAWLGRAQLDVAGYFFRNPAWLLLALAVLGGAFCWRTTRRMPLLCLCLPLVMALAASFFGYWPFGGNQHMVLAAPAVIVLTAEGIELVRNRLQRSYPWAAWALVGVLVLPGVGEAAYKIAHPRLKYELRPVIAFVLRHVEPGDHILGFDPAAIEFYAGRDFLSTPAEPSPSARVWFISIRDGWKPRTFTGQATLDRLTAHRQRLQAIEDHGAAAYLFAPEPAERTRETL